MAKILRALAGVIAVGWVTLALNSCGGGGGAAAPPSQYIMLTNGKVVTEQGAGVVIIKANQSQLPGVGFDDVVEVKLYRGDGFVNPRTDTPSSSDLLRTFRVSRDGTLLDDLQLPEGRYTAVAESIHVVQDGKEFRSTRAACASTGLARGGTPRAARPRRGEARATALGWVSGNSHVTCRADAGAVGRSSRLVVAHANGTVDMTRTFVGQTEAGVPVAAVSFEALPGGPTLGNVSRLILKAFKP